MLLNGEVPAGLDEQYARDLAGLADLVNLWLLRDIRFVVTASSLTDAKRITLRFLDRRLPAVEAIAQSLAFQLGDWNHPARPSTSPVPLATIPDSLTEPTVISFLRHKPLEHTCS